MLKEGEIDKVGEIDRVGNITQKERALSASGVTRRKVYDEILLLLSAVKVYEKVVDGMVVDVESPDLGMRARGVELALKAFGDLKEFVVQDAGVKMQNIVIVRTNGERITGRADAEDRFEAVAGQVHIQSGTVSGDVEFMGDGKKYVVDIPGDAVQSDDTEQSGDNISQGVHRPS